MGTDTEKASGHHGYRTPFFDEAVSERWYANQLNTKDSNLLPVGRQIKIYDGPERLDLLAIDADAVPWIFEFKRDVAKPNAMGQLMVYGSFIATRTRFELCELYRSRRPNYTLNRAFNERFKKNLPDELPRQVRLVLVSYSFSFACERALHFLEQATGIVVGQLQIRQLTPSPRGARVEHQWLKLPVATKALELPSEKEQPNQYFLLRLDNMAQGMVWHDSLLNNLLLIPNGYDIEANPIPIGSGIFVYVHGVPNNYETHDLCGLVGYGIVRDVARKVPKHRDSLRLAVHSTETLTVRESNCLLPVTWLETRGANEEPEVIESEPLECDGLHPLGDGERIAYYRQCLGVPKSLNLEELGLDRESLLL